MKRFGLTVLALGVVLAGCAQKKGAATADARLDRLEAGFVRFQEQQNAREADIDRKLTEIASRLDRLTTGLPPAPAGRKDKKAAPVRLSSSKSPVVLGQIVPYSSLVGNGSAQAAQTPPIPAQPTPLAQQPPVQSVKPAPTGPATPAAPAGAPRPGYEVSPPVVSLGPTYTNVPPAAQLPSRQPVPVARAGRNAPRVPEPRPQAVRTESQPAPVAAPAPAQAPGPVPSMEPAAPLPPAVPQAPGAKPAAQGQPSAVSVDEQMLYTEALRAVSSNKNDEGRKKFNDFLAKFPNSAKTPEALYWIGESYMGDKSYNQAILSFKDVTARFPKDPKAVEALYRIADAYERLGDKANAAFNLKLLADEHPTSEFAGKARQKLKQLGQ